MARTVSVREAGARLADLVATPTDTKEAIVMEEAGEAVAFLVAPEDFARINREREDPWAVIDRIRARMPDRDRDEVLREVTEAVEEVRHEMYEERQRASPGRS